MADKSKPSKPVTVPVEVRLCRDDRPHTKHGWYDGPEHDEYFCEGKVRG